MNSKRNGRKRGTLGLVVLVTLAPLFLHASRKTGRQMLLVSISNLQVSKDERVVGFEIHVSSGRIAALPNVPIGWDISVDNDPSWNTETKGSPKVGAAAVAPHFFHEFLGVEKHESTAAPFRMWGDIVVTEDFATERHILVENKDFTFKETVAQSSESCRKMDGCSLLSSSKTLNGF